MIFAGQISSVFIDNREVLAGGMLMLHALMISMPILGLLSVFSMTFQRIRKSIPTLVFAVSRQGFVFLPMLFMVVQLSV